MQSPSPTLRGEPMTYYYRTGPIGQLFSTLGPERLRRVALVGLGSGSLAAYAGRGQRFTFYEIDPAVLRIASNPDYFTYLSDARARGADVRVVLGDARLTIHDAPAATYNLIVLDAFSSDSIATHLITRQALRIYLEKLAPGGLISFHISNRVLDLKPLVGNLATDAGMTCLFQSNAVENQAEADRGKHAAQWTLLARRPSDFGPIWGDARWEQVRPTPGARVWTDDYSNILSILRWK
jgi:hypothetical protein